MSYPTTFTHMSNVLPSDQLLIRKLQIPIADLNIDFMLIKSSVEILVKDKIALVLQACKMLRILYSLFSFQRGQKTLTPYRRCSIGCRIWPLLTPELITSPVRGGTFAIMKLCSSHIGIFIRAKFLKM